MQKKLFCFLHEKLNFEKQFKYLYSIKINYVLLEAIIPFNPNKHQNIYNFMTYIIQRIKFVYLILQINAKIIKIY